MVKLVVYVRGGVVQDVITDSEGVEVMIVDYDDEACVQNLDRALDRSFQRVCVNPQLIAKTVSGIEDTSWN